MAVKYQALLAFVKREGHARVPLRHRERGLRLGRWASRMRQRYRKGTLTAEQIGLLERLSGWQWRLGPGHHDFDAMLMLLRRYAQREGHARVPWDYVEDGKRLGWWVVNRRQAFRRRRLARDRAAVLASLPGWTWNATADYTTADMLRLLRRFARREGHCVVPRRHVEDGVALGMWVHYRRRAFREGRRPSTLTRALESVPGWSWDPAADRFERMLVLLKRYAKRHGHARVARNHLEAGATLGQWVSQSRKDYKSGRLSRERIAAIEAVPEWTWHPGLGRRPGARRR